MIAECHLQVHLQKAPTEILILYVATTIILV